MKSKSQKGKTVFALHSWQQKKEGKGISKAFFLRSRKKVFSFFCFLWTINFPDKLYFPAFFFSLPYDQWFPGAFLSSSRPPNVTWIKFIFISSRLFSYSFKLMLMFLALLRECRGLICVCLRSAFSNNGRIFFFFSLLAVGNFFEAEYFLPNFVRKLR